MADIEHASFVNFEEDLHARIRVLIDEIKSEDIETSEIVTVLEELSQDIFLSLESGAELDEQLDALLGARDNTDTIREVIRELEWTDPHSPVLPQLRTAIGDSLIPAYS